MQTYVFAEPQVATVANNRKVQIRAVVLQSELLVVARLHNFRVVPFPVVKYAVNCRRGSKSGDWPGWLDFGSGVAPQIADKGQTQD
jgi:hypothetical protein